MRLNKIIVFRYSSNNEKKETKRENHYSSLRKDETKKPLFVFSKGQDENITTRLFPSNSLIVINDEKNEKFDNILNVKKDYRRV